MKKSIDFALDDHPEDDEDRPRTSWAVSARDDCDGCADPRVEINLEEQGRPGAGVTAHLSAAMARRVRGAIAAALEEIGEQAGP